MNSAIKALIELNRRNKNGCVYVVGGYVRDLARRKTSRDIDIVVTGMELANVRDFLRNYGSVKLIKLHTDDNPKFTTELLLFKTQDCGDEIQISLAKKGKNRRASIENTVKDDVKHRDFTINGLLLKIDDFNKPSKIIDYVEGRHDIKNKIIKAIGAPRQRILESPIRMMRAVSLAARFGYTIDSSLLAVIRKNCTLISKVPVEVVREEFIKILMSKTPSKFIRVLLDTGLLKQFAPELAKCHGVSQNEYHKYDVFTHLIKTVDYSDPDSLVLRLAGLLHDVGKPTTRRVHKVAGGTKVTFWSHECESARIARDFLKRMMFPNNVVESVVTLVAHHMYHYTSKWKPAALIRFINDAEIPEKYLKDIDEIGKFPLFRLRAAERLGNGFKDIPITDRQLDFERKLVETFKETSVFTVDDLDVDGDDLKKELKLKEGPVIGRLKKYLLNVVMEDQSLNKRSRLLEIARTYIDDK